MMTDRMEYSKREHVVLTQTRKLHNLKFIGMT